MLRGAVCQNAKNMLDCRVQISIARKVLAKIILIFYALIASHCSTTIYSTSNALNQAERHAQAQTVIIELKFFVKIRVAIAQHAQSTEEDYVLNV